jgi:predicted ATP-grasp superfamily ATP-dependent carboligase
LRIFAYEHACAVGDRARLPHSLRVEGWAMLSAALADLTRLPSTEVATLLSPSKRRGDRASRYRIVRPDDEGRAFDDLAAWADGVLLIAPETGGVLFDLCRRVELRGGRLMGPASAIVRLVSDKLALARHLRERGVPTPESRLVSPGGRPPYLSFPLVRKPRVGAGSQATFLVRSPAEWDDCEVRARGEGWVGHSIAQPFVPGRPASVAVLTGPRQQLPLLPAGQTLSADGRFRYEGGVLPLPDALADRAVSLARRAVAAVPGLLGNVGVDLVLGGPSDGSDDCVIEINPRLTTSYVGLRALAQTNLIGVLTRVLEGEAVAEPAWRPGRVCFRPDGLVSDDAGGP